VRLRDLRGLSYQEMVSELGVPEGTVKSRINRGREELARILLRKRQGAATAASRRSRAGRRRSQGDIRRR
jgi:RNA polymerase sigma-70 factor (ECF subfamily)